MIATQTPARRSNGPPHPVDESLLYARSFNALSVRDLLDARDQYHVHLAHKPNVIATAVGLFLIRQDDPDAHDHAKTPDAARKRGKYKARTLANSLVQPWSWPCVLVFVRQWKKQAEMAAPEEVVPPFLYLNDGRIIPVCVVEAHAAMVPPTPVPPSRLEVDVLRGGSPIYAMAQGQRRVGSVGCIVTDGTDYFALTNHHVAGEAGRTIQASLRGIGQTVGESASGYALGTRSFSEVYPSLQGRDMRVNLDAGLVHISNIWQWDTKITEVGTLGPMLDFSAETASLDWIGSSVLAYGAVSGHLAGVIRALFYRYAAIGGREFVTDFLIGPAAAAPDGDDAAGALRPAVTMPGDSGTLWCMQDPLHPGTVRPVALEWGGQKLASDQQGTMFTQFALASSISVICRELEVDIVTSFTEERVPYWGAVGHFKIAQQACFQVKDPMLRRLLQDNLNNISFSDDSNLKRATGLKADAFVPLSDVPDIVWKTNVNHVKPQVTRPTENTNHYADMDLPGADGRTLFEICGEPAQLDIDAWKAYYASVPPPRHAKPRANGAPARVEQGCLPFRVWQVFSQLQRFAAGGDVESFLCAAGILAHYVGDACQPLHSSQHSDGLEGATTGVHSTYEDNMVEAYAEQIATGIDQALSSGELALLPITKGEEAGNAVVELMRRCQTALPPETICRSYDRVHPGHVSATKSPEVLDALWADCGTGTIACIADGIRVLASLWEAAFASVNDKIPFKGAQSSENLRRLYEDRTFLPSRHLPDFTAADLPASKRNGTPARAPAGRGRGGARRPTA